MFSRYDHQVIVVPEKTVRHAAYAQSCERVSKQVEERAVIVVVCKDAGLFLSACEHMVDQAGRMQAQRATHCDPSRQDIRLTGTARKSRCSDWTSRRCCRTRDARAERSCSNLRTECDLGRGHLCKKQDLTPRSALRAGSRSACRGETRPARSARSAACGERARRERTCHPRSNRKSRVPSLRCPA